MGHLVEAQIRSGAVTDAKRSLAMLEETGRRTDPRWLNAGAAGCRSMLAGEDCYDMSSTPRSRSTEMRLGSSGPALSSPSG